MGWVSTNWYDAGTRLSKRKLPFASVVWGIEKTPAAIVPVSVTVTPERPGSSVSRTPFELASK